MKWLKNLFKPKCPKCGHVLTEEEQYKLEEYLHCTCSKCGIEIEDVLR